MQPQKMEILNSENALRIVLKRINEVPTGPIEPINNGRYHIIPLFHKKIAMLLKDKPFMNFGYMFQKLGEKGVGDSINVKHLKYMISRGVEDIYTIFRDGNLYKINIMTILRNSHKWTNKEGTEVRSFSIHLYKRV